MSKPDRQEDTEDHCPDTYALDLDPDQHIDIDQDPDQGRDITQGIPEKDLLLDQREVDVLMT